MLHSIRLQGETVLRKPLIVIDGNYYGLEPERIQMNIYIGNLPFNAAEDELKELFAAFGQVDLYPSSKISSQVRAEVLVSSRCQT